jgi:hypothetical protein
MVLSCRHCYSPGELKHDGKEDQSYDDKPSYMGLFVYDSNKGLLDMMEFIEAQKPAIPGVTIW